MAELPELDAIPGESVSDDDLLLIYDIANGRAYRVSRATLLGDVARENADATFANLSAEGITATQITPALLAFAGGGGIADMVTVTGNVTIPTLAAATAGSAALSVPGAASGMLVLATFTGGLAEGLTYTAHVSAGSTVTFRFVNATGASIVGASAAVRVACLALQ